MNEFTVKDFKFRIKKMNAIELLALKSSISFDNVDELKQTYDSLLERVEVNVKDNWLQVKQNDNYLPADIETDVELVDGLITAILQYIKSVFTKSNASKN